jgi:hypothetical protein
MVQQEKRAALEVAADSSVVRPELVDDRLIPIRHGYHSYTNIRGRPGFDVVDPSG